MVYGRYIYTIPVAYKPTFTSLGGVPPCVNIVLTFQTKVNQAIWVSFFFSAYTTQQEAAKRHGIQKDCVSTAWLQGFKRILPSRGFSNHETYWILLVLRILRWFFGLIGTWRSLQNLVKCELEVSIKMVWQCLTVKVPRWIYPLVIQHSHGQSLINGGFNR